MPKYIQKFSSYFSPSSRFYNWTTQHLILLAFLVCFTLHDKADYFFAERAGVMWWISLLVGIGVSKKYGVSAGILSGYAFCSMVYTVFWRYNHFAALGQQDIVLERGSLLGCAATLAILFTFYSEAISLRLWRTLLTAFGVFLCVHFWILSHFYFPDGHLMTQSLSGVYLGLILPFVSCPWTIVLFVGTILATKAYTAWLTLFGVLVGLKFKKEHWVRWVFGVGVSLVLAKYFLNPDKLHDGQGRYVVWKAVLDWWWHGKHRLFGLGSGTSYTLVPMLQADRNINIGGMMTYLHNEYLQTAFELGLVGLGLAVTFIVTRFRECLKNHNRAGTAFLCALLCSGLTMFPFRHEATLVVVLFGLSMTFRLDANKELR